MEAWIIKVVFTACFAFGLAIFNKYWDPIAAHIGYPFSVGINLVELGGKVKLLSEKQSDFSSCYPNRSSLEESKGWLSRVEDLVKKEKELKERYAKCGLLSYLSLCHVGKDVETELKKANELITQGDRLLANVKALPLTLHDVQPRDQPVPDFGANSDCGVKIVATPQTTKVTLMMIRGYESTLNMLACGT